MGTPSVVKVTMLVLLSGHYFCSACSRSAADTPAHEAPPPHPDNPLPLVSPHPVPSSNPPHQEDEPHHPVSTLQAPQVSPPAQRIEIQIRHGAGVNPTYVPPPGYEHTVLDGVDADIGREEFDLDEPEKIQENPGHQLQENTGGSHQLDVNIKTEGKNPLNLDISVEKPALKVSLKTGVLADFNPVVPEKKVPSESDSITFPTDKPETDVGKLESLDGIYPYEISQDLNPKKQISETTAPIMQSNQIPAVDKNTPFGTIVPTQTIPEASEITPRKPETTPVNLEFRPSVSEKIPIESDTLTADLLSSETASVNPETPLEVVPEKISPPTESDTSTSDSSPPETPDIAEAPEIAENTADLDETDKPSDEKTEEKHFGYPYLPPPYPYPHHYPYYPHPPMYPPPFYRPRPPYMPYG